MHPEQEQRHQNDADKQQLPAHVQQNLRKLHFRNYTPRTDALKACKSTIIVYYWHHHQTTEAVH